MTHSQLQSLEQPVTRYSLMSQSSRFKYILMGRDQEVDAHDIFVASPVK